MKQIHMTLLAALIVCGTTSTMQQKIKPLSSLPMATKKVLIITAVALGIYELNELRLRCNARAEKKNAELKAQQKNDQKAQQKKFQESVLRVAAAQGHLNDVMQALDAGVDINAQDMRGNTAFFFAAYNHRREVIKLLLDRGADITVCGEFGPTAEQAAVMYSFIKSASLL